MSTAPTPRPGLAGRLFDSSGLIIAVLGPLSDAATEDAAARWPLVAEWSHEIGVCRVTPLARSDHDLGADATRDRSCYRTKAVVSELRTTNELD